MRLAALLLLIFLAGCSPKRVSPFPESQSRDADAADYSSAAEYEDETGGQAPAAGRAMNMYMDLPVASAPAPPSMKKAGFSSASRPYPSPAPAQAPAAPYAQAAPAREKRLVHYSGSATLRSTEPERILDSAIAIVTASGGYLERREPGYAALRVPAGEFDSLFLRLMRLAEVIDYNQQAEDITEAVQDTDLRLKVVVATLERLEDLIKKARTEAQKLRLLGELKRFREEREILEARKRDLIQRARFASIQLRVRTHAPQASSGLFSRDLADFRWIHRLNPFDDRRFAGRWRVKFPAPAGMVVTRKWFPWRATSSKGSEFWGSEVEVDLEGDSRFWREAVRSRLEPGFKSTDTVEAGKFLFCRFQSFGPTPYFYWVGIRSRGDELDVAEFYFPTEEQQTQLLPGMLAAVERKSR